MPQGRKQQRRRRKNMRITARITDHNPGHTRLSLWVNGGLVTSPGGICLRNDEVVPFLRLLKIDNCHTDSAQGEESMLIQMAEHGMKWPKEIHD